MHPADSSHALLVVAKRPAPGQAKTRLTPPLSPQQAADLYEAFLLDTIDLMRSVPGVQPAIAYLPAGEEAYFRNLAPGFELLLQNGPNLGARLDNAFHAYLSRGFRAVVIVDSDSPTLPLSSLTQAFSALEGGADMVLGPCDDGGYYLIGLKRPAPRLLREVPMSTPQVTLDTLRLAEQEGLDVALLPQWYDVDEAASLDRLKMELSENPGVVARQTRLALCALNGAYETCNHP